MNRHPDDRAALAGADAEVEVRAEGVRVDRTVGDAGVGEARRRYSGVERPATLGGSVPALGTTVLVGGLLAGAGTVGYDRGLKGQEEPSAGGLVAGLLALLVGFQLGGWVAGRMARYHGGRNWLMTVWFPLLGAAAALGAWVGRSYAVFDRLRLPQWFAANARGTRGIAQLP